MSCMPFSKEIIKNMSYESMTICIKSWEQIEINRCPGGIDEGAGIIGIISRISALTISSIISIIVSYRLIGFEWVNISGCINMISVNNTYIIRLILSIYPIEIDVNIVNIDGYVA